MGQQVCLNKKQEKNQKIALQWRIVKNMTPKPLSGFDILVLCALVVPHQLLSALGIIDPHLPNITGMKDVFLES